MCLVRKGPIRFEPRTFLRLARKAVHSTQTHSPWKWVWPARLGILGKQEISSVNLIHCSSLIASMCGFVHTYMYNTYAPNAHTHTHTHTHSLAELPECRLQIASNTKILEQFIAVILSPTYKYIASLATIAGMLCLAYSPETHPYLTRPEVTEGVIEACEIHRPWILTCVHLEEESRMDNLLLRYSRAHYYWLLVPPFLKIAYGGYCIVCTL